MLFNSTEFFLFLGLVVALYWWVPRRLQNAILLAGSAWFYISWTPSLLCLLGIPIVVDYVCAREIGRSEDDRQRKLLMGCSVGLNVIILCFFKYCNFFLDSFEALATRIGLGVDLPTLSLFLPIGISFYTFKTISYVVDVYRRKLEPEPEFWNYALFLSFFPSLLAGPIDRAGQLLPQIRKARVFDSDRLMRGLYLILFGFVKKIAIGDGLSPSTTAIFQGSGAVSPTDVLAATLLYSLQIYCDFSGYSDIARGIAKLFGIDLIVNFKLPYMSLTPSEFWQRWHISLSSWLRDYLYISLGGNRKGEFNTYRNLMVTMTLGGLWHGATWNFVLWGVYQGAVLCGYKAIAPNADKTLRTGGWPILAWPLFMGITGYGWLLFGVTDLGRIRDLSLTLLTGWGNLAMTIPKPPIASLLGIALLVVYEIVELLAKRPQFYQQLARPVRGILYGLLLFLLLMSVDNVPAQFIYTKF
jgi:alginate O-acetyltransferase complex protein AlgI